MIVEAGVTDIRGVRHHYAHNRHLDCWVCGLILSGRSRVKMVGKEWEWEPPYIVYSRPGVRYEYETLPPHEGYSIYAIFRPGPERRWALHLPERPPGRGVLQLAGHPYRAEIIAAFEEMYRWSRTFLPRSGELAANALERAYLLAGSCEARSPSVLDTRLKEVNDFILSHIDAALTIEEMAGVANLSVSRFAHLFRDVLGCTPMQYVERVRMTEAGALLRNTGLPVGEVARRVGYPSPFYFSSRFTRHMKVSPSLFRAGKAPAVDTSS